MVARTSALEVRGSYPVTAFPCSIPALCRDSDLCHLVERFARARADLKSRAAHYLFAPWGPIGQLVNRNS